MDRQSEGKMRQKVEESLARVRPALQADGGDVERVDVKDGVVMLKLTVVVPGAAHE